jgi:hypothetical protein
MTPIDVAEVDAQAVLGVVDQLAAANEGEID